MFKLKDPTIILDDKREITLDKRDFDSVNDLKRSVIETIYDEELRATGTANRAYQEASSHCGLNNPESVRYHIDNKRKRRR